jgi:DNA helicase-2/ATP-dependent DNA helicase PcrA
VFGSGRPAPRPAVEPPRLTAGDTVEHRVFGRGKVKAIDGDKVVIAFPEPTGEKKVLLGYAPIRKVEGG